MEVSPIAPGSGLFFEWPDADNSALVKKEQFIVFGGEWKKHTFVVEEILDSRGHLDEDIAFQGGTIRQCNLGILPDFRDLEWLSHGDGMTTCSRFPELRKYLGRKRISSRDRKNS